MAHRASTALSNSSRRPPTQKDETASSFPSDARLSSGRLPRRNITARVAAALLGLDHVSGPPDQRFCNPHGDRPCDTKRSQEQDQERHQAKGRIFVVHHPTDQEPNEL